MMKTATRLFGVLLAMCVVTSVARANHYPSGPGNCCPDTLVYINKILNTSLRPTGFAIGDTVYGLGGIVVAKDTIPTGFAIYIENNSADGPGGTAGPWHGIDVFTEGNNPGNSIGVDGTHPAGISIGDSVFTYGATDQFGGSTELRSFGRSFTNPNGPYIVLESRGNKTPDYHVGSVHELYELTVPNPSAAQWVLNLVSVTQTMRVARVGLTSTSGSPRDFLVVDNSACPPSATSPCDSMYIETRTLAGVEPPPLSAPISFARGLYNITNRGYEIMLRDPTDLGDLQPPKMIDAWSITNDSLLVVYDRAVTSGSALNGSNYSLDLSAGTINPVHMVGTKRVVCFINNGETPGQPDSVTTNHLVGQTNGVMQTAPAGKRFTYGILSIAQIRTPSPDSLNLAPCKDVSQFLGGDGGLSARLTYQGVCTAAKLGSLYYLEDAGATNPRTGCAVFAPSSPLTVGHKYQIVSNITDFFKEYELQGTVSITDLGANTVPTPLVVPIHTLNDTTCDVNQNITNGVDYCGDLVQVQNAKITGFAPILAGDTTYTPRTSFFISGPYPNGADTIEVRVVDAGATKFSNLKDNYRYGDIVNVTGICHLVFGSYVVDPRDSTDIVVLNNNGVPPALPKRVSFSIAPNPARTQRLTFALPKESNVDLSVFDVAGRKLATIARGQFAPGTYSRVWDGSSGSGQVGAGVFFYRLTVDGVVYKTQGVRLK